MSGQLDRDGRLCVTGSKLGRAGLEPEEIWRREIEPAWFAKLPR